MRFSSTLKFERSILASRRRYISISAHSDGRLCLYQPNGLNEMVELYER